MPVATVSTYAVFQSTLDDVSRVMNNLAAEQQQLSSGNAAQYFSDMPGQTQQFLSLDNTIAKINEYSTDNGLVLTRINSAHDALSQVINIATNIQNMISQRRTGVAVNSSFAAQLEAQWRSLAGQMNLQVEGQYVFSGTKINTPPVDANRFPTLVQPGIPDASYYQGNQQDISLRASDSVTLTYNVRGDSKGFQNIIAAIAIASQGDQANNDAMFQQAEDLVQQGIEQITSVQSTVGSNAAELTNINQNLSNSKLYWTGIQQQIGNTDVVAVSTAVAQNQGVLQSAFQAFAKITSLRLSDYLK